MQIIFPDDRIVKYKVDKELQHFIEEPIETGRNVLWYWWLIIGISSLLIGLLIKQSFNKPKVKPDVARLILFKEYSGKLIDSDELDKILGLDEIKVYETRKYKRAALIRELNSLSKYKYGHELILREKNPEDKRFYLYRIQPLGAN